MSCAGGRREGRYITISIKNGGGVLKDKMNRGHLGGRTKKGKKTNLGEGGTRFNQSGANFGDRANYFQKSR